MTRGRLFRSAALAAVTAGLISGASASAGTSAPTTQQKTCPILGMDADSVTLAGPSVLWPANHRLVPYTLTAAETPQEAGDPLPHGVTISYTITTTDAAHGTGGPAHGPDAVPASGNASGDFSVPVRCQLRAERAGAGAGRTYRIDWSATFDGGPHRCSSTDDGQQPFIVTVPHDRRR
jgi:hypothetical protein